jgi:polysaccharide deacetylase family protein (PEP-CTERM system associated)
MINALTVDIEDWYQATFLGVPEVEWPSCERRLADSTRRVLDILAEAGVRATFFVLGCLAQEAPEVVRSIVQAGHEVGCHSYNHRQVFRQTPSEFANDVKQSVRYIEDASQERLLGFRAPAGSIGTGQLWAFDILADHGFLYDSSVFPVHTPLYGDNQASRFPHRVAGGRLLEIPLATIQFKHWRFPVSGGVYFRMIPYRLFTQAIRRLNQVEGQPAVIYLHPWEIDPRPPPKGRNWLTRWSHTINKRGMEIRVRKLVNQFSFAPIREVFNLDGGSVHRGQL